MLGTVTMLRRYPVKSMLGEEVPASDVTGRGLAHDRALALVHTETGKVASAKNPRLWRGLLKLAAAVDTGPGVTGRAIGAGAARASGSPCPTARRCAATIRASTPCCRKCWACR